MKLTKPQLNELLNQHTGTGHMLIKVDSKTVRIHDIYLAKNGRWYTGLDGKPLEQRLEDTARDIIDD